MFQTVHITSLRVAAAAALLTACAAGSRAHAGEAVGTIGVEMTITSACLVNGAARPWRTMTDGAGRTLNYNLYRGDGSTIWDQSNPMPAPEAGTGSEAPGQAISYTARIDPAQPTPPAGQYSDTVSVVLTF